MHIYNLVEKAPGPMVCDLDVSLADHAIVLEDDRLFVKTCPPINVAGIIYEGAFPIRKCVDGTISIGSKGHTRLGMFVSIGCILSSITPMILMTIGT